MIMPFVAVALSVCDKMHIADKQSQGMIMKFCKMYRPEKIGKIVENAQKKVWWESNPKAAFMMSVGEINRQEKGEVKK